MELEQRALNNATKPKKITKAEKNRAAALTAGDAAVVQMMAKQSQSSAPSNHTAQTSSPSNHTIALAPKTLNFSVDSDIFVAYQKVLGCTPEQFLEHECTPYLIERQISNLAQLC